MVAVEDRRQHVGRDCRRRAEGELAGASPGELRDQVPAFGDRLQRALCVGKKGATGLREADAATGSDEELGVQLALEALETSRERRLGQEERLGRAA